MWVFQLSLLFITGIIIGSFLNVIIYRLPNNVSIVTPRSYCPHCRKTIPFYRNIPLLSFLFQKGRCAECREKISFRYPVVELLTGVLWMWAFNVYPLPKALLFVWMSGILTVIAFIDAKHFTVPLSLIVAMFAVLFIYNISEPTMVTDSIIGGIVGTTYLGLVLGLTWLLFKKQTMGFGDLQLVFICGIWLGAIQVLLMIFMSSIIALFYWGFISFRSATQRNQRLPFASFIAPVTIIIYAIGFEFTSLGL